MKFVIPALLALSIPGIAQAYDADEAEERKLRMEVMQQQKRLMKQEEDALMLSQQRDALLINEMASARNSPPGLPGLPGLTGLRPMPGAHPMHRY